MRPVVVASCVLLSVPLLLTCGGESTGPLPPDPGAVELRLATPNTDDGIMRIVVTGGSVGEVRSARFQVRSAKLGSDSTAMVIRGDLSSGVVAEMTVPDRHLLAGYAARVDQAASRRTYGLQDVSGYHVSLVKP